MPSSVIKHFGYDPLSETLRVIFVSGLTYEYKKVPEAIYYAMRAARSKGQFLNKHIKAFYDFVKIADGPRGNPSLV